MYQISNGTIALFVNNYKLINYSYCEIIQKFLQIKTFELTDLLPPSSSSYYPHSFKRFFKFSITANVENIILAQEKF